MESNTTADDCALARRRVPAANAQIQVDEK